MELDFSQCPYPLPDLIETICTTRINPNDETSPLKYGKLRQLRFYDTEVTDYEVKLIVENLTDLTHLELGYSSCRRRVVTDKTITALLATERADLAYPYITLPNLTHLDLRSSGITSGGLIELSKSRLFSQLEELDVGECEARWDGNYPQLPPGLLPLLTNSRFSKLNLLRLDGLIPSYISSERLKDDYPEIFNILTIIVRLIINNNTSITY